MWIRRRRRLVKNGSGLIVNGFSFIDIANEQILIWMLIHAYIRSSLTKPSQHWLCCFGWRCIFDSSLFSNLSWLISDGCWTIQVYSWQTGSGWRLVRISTRNVVRFQQRQFMRIRANSRFKKKYSWLCMNKLAQYIFIYYVYIDLATIQIGYTFGSLQ